MAGTDDSTTNGRRETAGQGPVRVLVELRVPEHDSVAAAATLAAALENEGFEFDQSYGVIPMKPPPDVAASLEAGHQTLAMIRGTIEAARLPKLKARDEVFSVSVDTRIAHFGPY